VRIAICGAGAVGLAIGARLARAGCAVMFAVRSPEVARSLEDRGVRCDDVAAGSGFRAGARASADPGEAAAFARGGLLFFCVRRSQTAAAARDLAAAEPAAAVSFQNDVDNEAVLARHFARVIGGVVRQTTTRVAPDSVRLAGAGRLVLGDHPEGFGATAAWLADRLEGAGYAVGRSRHIVRDKWLKLCVNLMSAPNALIRREDHETEAFVEVKVRLLEEARAALAAAGVDARPCDAGDRSLDEEIAHQRGALERGDSARRLPIYNQVWASLRHDLPLEADGYHRRILELGERAGLALPTNQRVLAVLEETARLRRGPEQSRAVDLLPAP
jgi:2-dehydropantoate 2-reductase